MCLFPAPEPQDGPCANPRRATERAEHERDGPFTWPIPEPYAVCPPGDQQSAKEVVGPEERLGGTVHGGVPTRQERLRDDDDRGSIDLDREGHVILSVADVADRHAQRPYLPAAGLERLPLPRREVVCDDDVRSSRAEQRLDPVEHRLAIALHERMV